MYSITEIAQITSGDIKSSEGPSFIQNFIIDSRNLINRPESIFVAIKGVRHNGHDFIPELYKKGFRQFIVEDSNRVALKFLENSNVLEVKNATLALQEIAHYHRNKFNIPVIGITGSNGKTIVKEWLGQLLAGKYKIIKSPKSYNSQIGVPLSVLLIEPYHTLGIFEAGISLPGEMQQLSPIIKPTIGIFTNIGSAHDEGFITKTQKISEKWLLFQESETVIYCEDHRSVANLKPDNIKNTFTWGKDKASKLRILDIKYNYDFQSLIQLRYEEKIFDVLVPFTDAASIENLMHCIALMLVLDFDISSIQSGLSSLSKIAMRLELKQGINNCYVIDDTYNNDVAGLHTALDFLYHQKGKRKTVILSDILQSGLQEEKRYNQVNKLLTSKQVGRFIGIGPCLVKYKNIFQGESNFYSSTEAFLSDFEHQIFKEEVILVKGARDFGFERITKNLSQKLHGTVLEIDLDALTNNLNFYRSKLRPGVKLMVMVKASAYGSSSFELANLLQFHRVDYLAVAYPDEGVELRQRGIEMPIMVMNASPDTYEKMIRYNLEPEIYNINQLKSIAGIIKNEQKPVKVHIKIDTGMHRLGFEKGQINELIHFLKHHSQIEVASIYSHLAGADEELHNSFSKHQVKLFDAISEHIKKSLGINTLKHILNSAGIVRFPGYQFNMVRLGIGLYGVEANNLEQNGLKPISCLKTIISQIRIVKKGETIGYGRKGIAKRDSKIATIAIGYADGFTRAFGNGKISVNVNGKLAPVIGNVCMDMTMIDITGINAKEGDEVIIFGQYPTINQLAEAINTIPYEILTNVSDRVKRVFYSS